MSAADLTPMRGGPQATTEPAAPRAVVRLLRSGRLTEAQRARIRLLYPALYAQFTSVAFTAS